jgi:hypothetical protein
MPALVFIAGLFGISVLRLVIYAACVVAVIATGLTIRQHYVHLGFAKAIAAVKKQDDRAVAAAEKVEQKAAVCTETNGFWDVVTQGCKLEEDTP